MDNGDISEDTTLVETSPSTLQAQPTITSLNNSEDFATSRESTPCPTIQPSKIPCANRSRGNVEMTDEKTEQDLTEIDQLPCAMDNNALKNHSKRNITKWRMI